MVRHDIRNDLQLILASAEMLKAGADGSYKQVETILESTRQAIELTDTARSMADVLLQTGTGRYSVDIGTVLRSEIDEVDATNLDAVITVEGTLPHTDVHANKMLGSVSRNLLTNAIQHNDTDQPEITISATADATDVVVHIADNGPGIPDEQQDDIFGNGYRSLSGPNARRKLRWRGPRH